MKIGDVNINIFPALVICLFGLTGCHSDSAKSGKKEALPYLLDQYELVQPPTEYSDAPVELDRSYARYLELRKRLVFRETPDLINTVQEKTPQKTPVKSSFQQSSFQQSSFQLWLEKQAGAGNDQARSHIALLY